MILATLLAQAAVAVPARPGALRTFADWIVGCDNLRSCQAVALVPEGEDRGAYLMLVLRRDGGVAAPAQLEIRFPANVRRGAILQLTIDGASVAQLQAPGGAAGMALPFAGAIGDALVNGKQAALVDARGTRIARVSLAGLSAAVLHIDEAQGRIGTRRALRRPGTRPAGASSVPPLPVIRQPPVTGQPPRTLSAKDATKLIGSDDATCANATRAVMPQAARLDATHSVVTIDHPCGNDAYNFYTSVYLLDEKGRASRAPLEVSAAMAPDDSRPVVINGGWDAKRRRLTSFARGRGIGDCGSMQEYAWDGTMFRLTQQRDMGECRGSSDYITTWRARVVVE